MQNRELYSVGVVADYTGRVNNPTCVMLIKPRRLKFLAKKNKFLGMKNKFLAEKLSVPWLVWRHFLSSLINHPIT